MLPPTILRALLGPALPSLTVTVSSRASCPAVLVMHASCIIQHDLARCRPPAPRTCVRACAPRNVPTRAGASPVADAPRVLLLSRTHILSSYNDRLSLLSLFWVSMRLGISTHLVVATIMRIRPGRPAQSAVLRAISLTWGRRREACILRLRGMGRWYIRCTQSI